MSGPPMAPDSEAASPGAGFRPLALEPACRPPGVAIEISGIVPGEGEMAIKQEERREGDRQTNQGREYTTIQNKYNVHPMEEQEI